MNPVSRHWMGHYTLLVTILVVLVGLRLLHGVLQAEFLLPRSVFSSTLWVGSSLVLLFWQLLGSQKAINRSMNYSGDMVAVYLCYLSMALVLVLSLLQLGDAVAAVKKTNLMDNYVAVSDVALPLSNQAKVVTIEGDLDFSLNQRLVKTLAQHPQIDTLLLNSEGGRVFAARALAISIESAGLNTRVDGVCHSACTLVFMAGKKRELSEGAVLGFHRYQLSTTLPGKNLSIDDQLDKDRVYFMRRGADAAFVRQMFEQDSSDLWLPSRELLTSSGVLNSK